MPANNVGIAVGLTPRQAAQQTDRQRAEREAARGERVVRQERERMATERRMRTLRDYLIGRKVAVRIDPIMGPRAANETQKWLVTLRGPKRKASVVIVSGYAPSKTEAVGLMIDAASTIDSGRGDCACGCGITNLTAWVSMMGLRGAAGAEQYQRALDAAKALRAVFGNGYNGYQMVLTRDRYHPSNQVAW